MLFRAAQIPLWLYHDPICFMLGISICWLIVLIISKARPRTVRRYIQSIKNIPLPVLKKGSVVLLCWLGIEVAVGVILQVLLSHSFHMSPFNYYSYSPPSILSLFWSFTTSHGHTISNDNNNMSMYAISTNDISPQHQQHYYDIFSYLFSPSNLLSIYLKGSTVSCLAVGCLLYGYFDRILHMFHFPTPAVTAVAATGAVEQIPHHMIGARDPIIQSALGRSVGV